MSMQDVKTARDIEDLKLRIFANFHELFEKLEQVGENVIDYNTGNVIAPSGPGGNMFDTIYLKDANTYITRDGDGDMVFHDANSGTITLAQIKLIVDIFWSYGNAYGVKFANKAGTERYIHLYEDADGVGVASAAADVE